MDRNIFAMTAALLAATAAPTSAEPTAAFVLHLNADGYGTWELRASVGGDPSEGLASYAVTLDLPVGSLDHVAPVAEVGGGSGTAGFSLLRSGDGDRALTASQDTLGLGGIAVSGFGQEGGDLAVLGSLVSAEQPEYGADLLIAHGQWAGSPPAFESSPAANVLRADDPTWTQASSVATASEGGAGCAADWNSDGAVSVQDLLGYLRSFRAREIRADVDGSGATAARDLLAYLRGFRNGC